jgi:hypothetical protein
MVDALIWMSILLIAIATAVVIGAAHVLPSRHPTSIDDNTPNQAVVGAS